MSFPVCRICHSYAISPGHHGRPDFSEQVDHDLCDVCFYRTRFEAKRAAVDTLIDKLVDAVWHCPTKTVECWCHEELHYDTVNDYSALRKSFKEILTAPTED